MSSGIRTPNLPSGLLIEVLGHADAGGGRRVLVRSNLSALVDALRGIISNDPAGTAALRAALTVLENSLRDETDSRQLRDDQITQAFNTYVEQAQGRFDRDFAALNAAVGAERQARSGRDVELTDALNGLANAVAAEAERRVSAIGDVLRQLGAEQLVRGQDDLSIRGLVSRLSLDLRAAIEAETKGRSEADEGEQKDRVAAFELLSKRLEEAVAALTDLVAAKATAADVRALSVSVAAQQIAFAPTAHRPGEAPGAFGLVSSLSGLAGFDLAAPPLDVGLLTYSDAGRVARLKGTMVLARRAGVPIEAGRIYRARCVTQRRANPTDPSNDAVQFGLAFLDQAMNVLPVSGFLIVRQLDTFTVSDGRIEVQAVFSRSRGQDVPVLAPPRTRYVRPFVRTFGPDGITDVEVLQIEDVTLATVLDPVSADLAAQVNAISSGDPLARIAALEARTSAPQSLAFGTKSDAASALIPESVRTVDLRGGDQPGDGRGGLYVRTADPIPPGADAFIASGAKFLRVYRPNDVFTAEMKRWFDSLPDVEPATPGQPWRNSNTLAWS